MNQITLIGHLAFPPTYHCTHQGQDLTRFEIRTAATEDDKPEAHHCTAWGPAALDLHQHLHPGDRLLVRGELRYRSRTLRQGGTLRVPVIYVRGYSYLGRWTAEPFSVPGHFGVASLWETYVFLALIWIIMTSFHSTTYQIVFGTKYRRKSMTKVNRRRLYKYIYGIC